MINTLTFIFLVCIFSSLINFYQLKKSISFAPVLNVSTMLLISISTWLASFFYIDDLGISGGYLHTILLCVQFAIALCALLYYLSKK